MKCSVPHCPNEASEVVKIRHVVGEPEAALCSEHASRFRKIEHYWGLINWSALAKVYPLFNTAIILLGNAALLFAMGFNDASAVMTRASLEAALHSALSMRSPRFDNNGVLITYNRDEAYDKYHLKQLISEAVRRNMLNSDLIKCAERIRDYGNLAAHISEAQLRWLRQLARSKSIETIDLSSLKLWVNDNDVEDALKCAVEIINNLKGLTRA